MSLRDVEAYEVGYDSAREAIASAEQEEGELEVAYIGDLEIYFDGKQLGVNYVARLEEKNTLYIDDETSHGEIIVDELTPEVLEE
ncbi:MAG: hypothetical protein ABEK16_00780 [Candidatus Nanohalobium sp.]